MKPGRRYSSLDLQPDGDAISRLLLTMLAEDVPLGRNWDLDTNKSGHLGPIQGTATAQKCLMFLADTQT